MCVYIHAKSHIIIEHVSIWEPFLGLTCTAIEYTAVTKCENRPVTEVGRLYRYWDRYTNIPEEGGRKKISQRYKQCETEKEKGAKTQILHNCTEVKLIMLNGLIMFLKTLFAIYINHGAICRFTSLL